MNKTLYVNRPLINTHRLVKWAQEVGIQNIEHEHDMHVTIAYSKKPVDWSKFTPEKNRLVVSTGKREVVKFGEYVVMTFENNILFNRWKYFADNGCSYDYKTYRSHISLSKKSTIPITTLVNPYREKLVFGNEIFDEVDEEWLTNRTVVV